MNITQIVSYYKKMQWLLWATAFLWCINACIPKYYTFVYYFNTIGIVMLLISAYYTLRADKAIDKQLKQVNL